MKNLICLCVAAAVGSCVASAALAAELKVIANTSVSTSAISSEELKGVFLETKSSLGGAHAEPVLQKGGAVHEAVVKEFLGKTDAALQTYYRSLVFTGKASMPKVVGSDADVVAYVAKTKGAIGYVSASTDTPGVKTLDVK